jgi:hypothetical protein
VAQLEGALAAASGMVEGTVERVKFKAANGYTVLRMTAVQATGQPPPQQQQQAGAQGATPAKGARCMTPPLPTTSASLHQFAISAWAVTLSMGAAPSHEQ